MPLRPHLPGQFQVDAHRLKQPGHVLMGDRHTLRDAGSTRGVDEVGDVIGRRERRCGTGLALNGRIVDIDGQKVEPIELIGHFWSGDRGHRRGVGKNEFSARSGHRRVDRHIRGTGLEHRQNPHDRLSRSRQHKRHPLARPCTMANQQVRQTVRGLI